jgi:predicted amidophosphoribosyltransferase
MFPVVPFASCYVYSPAGNCLASARSRLVRALLKAGDEEFLRRYAARVHRLVETQPGFGDWFAAPSVLIPVPGSAPCSSRRPWVAEGLARALAREGLGLDVWTGLHRLHPVHKSATAHCGRRPTVATHYGSFAVDPSVTAPADCVLVDDVVTKGRTLLAAAMRVQEAFPGVRVRAFALLRTMGRVPEIERLIEPCRGEIRWRCGDARRTP